MCDMRADEKLNNVLFVVVVVERSRKEATDVSNRSALATV